MMTYLFKGGVSHTKINYENPGLWGSDFLVFGPICIFKKN